MKRTSSLTYLSFALALGASVSAQSRPRATVSAGTSTSSVSAFTSSPTFQALGLRCGTPPFDPLRFATSVQPPSDCAYGSTNIQSEYDPGETYTIPVVVHVIQRTNGTGFISQSMVQSQIDILNEDFLAISGTNGAPGTNCEIQFELASEDPNGQPTNGITYSSNNNWFNDSGSYWNSLAWDTNSYLNIYTNDAGGYLGYVPDLPQGGIVGSNSDRVVVYWESFGRNGPIGPPYDQGRTTTHEVGHYLGLWHTFDGGCSGGNCYSNGDRICDTNPESGPNYNCANSQSSCGSSDPFHNYMDYTDDICMWEFTSEQMNRMRCTLEHWRPDLGTTGGGGGDPPGDDPASLNIDIGANTTYPVPGNNYGGVASQSGNWNGVNGNASNQSLVAIDGSASGVSISVSGGNGNFDFDNSATSGNAERILDDLQDAGNSTWTLSGVPDGTYDVYLYSWAPDDPLNFDSQLTVVGGAAGAQVCGGANWSGSFVQGSHYVTDRVTVSSGTITIQVAMVGGSPSSLNAIQVVSVDGGSSTTPYCFGDGSGANCPCGNTGATGAGCATTSTAGAVLTSSGNPDFSADTFALSVSGIPGAKAGLCVKGSVQTGGGFGNPVGDGLLCTTPELRSQVIVSNGAGNLDMNNWRSVPFSSYLGAANLGSSTYYQWWFREPTNPCSGQGFNFSNGLEVVWQ